MATRTIVTCDLCKEEIKPGARVVRFSACRWEDMNTRSDLQVISAKFDMSEFCSDGCVLAAVRGLLNGAA